ncbi:hypothetical protein [Arachidicoccus sp.]|uniref:hypothetical protein n=1 Tax=Arachidicoccus sp. TaxID=1872624 RepID=UPI003D1F2323
MKAKQTSTKQPENKIISKKTWLVEVSFFDDGSNGLKRTNDGFTSWELMGLLEITKKDLFDQLEKRVTPDYIERKVVK